MLCPGLGAQRKTQRLGRCDFGGLRQHVLCWGIEEGRGAAPLVAVYLPEKWRDSLSFGA